MGDAADDYYDALERQSARADMTREWAKKHCPQWDCEARMFRNNDGFLECKQCGETFDD